MRWSAPFTLSVLLGILLTGGCPIFPSPSGSTGSPGGTTTPPADGASGSTGVAGSADGQLCSSCLVPSSYDSWQAEVLQLINTERVSRGVATLVLSQTLEDQANGYACEMICYDFFAHENPVTGMTLPDRAREFGYDYQVIGENLAAGQQSPVEVVVSWMGSPAHRENILDARFTELGIGIRSGGSYGLYWVLELGCPR